MPIRTVKQHTDRGSIKNLVAKAGEIKVVEEKPLPSELRMKKLYEYALINKDAGLQEILGFITTDYISDKNALPLSIYRLRNIVDDIKAKSGGRIDQLSEEFSDLFGETPGNVLGKEYLKLNAMVKTASNRRPPIFWRASKA